MSRQNYAYTTGPTVSRQISSNHGTSSAFSSSANPDEDWTKISDLAERRRIQNRIAQRNYRKKLKRRLEDLERRAGSSSASPPQTHTEIQPPNRNDSSQHYRRSPELRQQQISPRLVPSQYNTPLSEDDLMFSSQHGYDREDSRTPPMFGAYQSQYPVPEGLPNYTPYPQSNIYSSVSSTGGWSRPEDYTPLTLPPMNQFESSVKREHDHEDTMSPYNMIYQPVLPAMDIHSQHGYGASNPTTPPLSHSYENSIACPDTPSYYPDTPGSMPASPRLMN